MTLILDLQDRLYSRLTRCKNRLRQPGPDPLWSVTLTPGGEGVQRNSYSQAGDKGPPIGGPEDRNHVNGPES